MMRREVGLIGVCIAMSIIFTSIGSTVAWGEEGHSIVAALAQSMLTNRSLEWVCFLERNSTPSLVEICAAPDAYDNTPEGYWSGPLHFVNLPFLADRFNYIADCTTSINFMCVVSAIMNYTALLEDQVAKDIPNEISNPEPSPLAFLIHLLGDIHQPMHVSYGCDEGGNQINTRCDYIEGQGEIYDVLHKVWDTVFVQSYSDSYMDWVEKLQATIASNASIVPDAIKDFGPSVWAQESYQITRVNAYWFNVPYDPYPTNETHYPEGNQCPYPKTVDLTDEYYHLNFPVISQRLMLGGIRLAHLLNTVFAEKAPPANTRCNL